MIRHVQDDSSTPSWTTTSQTGTSVWIVSASGVRRWAPISFRPIRPSIPVWWLLQNSWLRLHRSMLTSCIKIWAVRSTPYIWISSPFLMNRWLIRILRLVWRWPRKSHRWCWLCAVKWTSRCVSHYRPSWFLLLMLNSRSISRLSRISSWTRWTWRSSVSWREPVYWWRRWSAISVRWARSSVSLWRVWPPLWTSSLRSRLQNSNSRAPSASR